VSASAAASLDGHRQTRLSFICGRIRDLNRLELAGQTVRAALEALAAAAPGWLAGLIDASWQEVYGQRIDGMRLPTRVLADQALAFRLPAPAWNQSASSPRAAPGRR
jgi:hypothetical protein